MSSDSRLQSTFFTHAQVPVYYMDALFFPLLIICWGLTFPTPESGINPKEMSIQQYFPFILNAPLAVLCLVSGTEGQPFAEGQDL